MGLKTYNAYTSGIRQRVDIDRSDLWKGSPFKKLCVGLSAKGGRNSNGHMTVRHRAAYGKKTYRIISFDRRFLEDTPVKVVRIEYDPNRTCHIALVEYEKNSKLEHAYILAPDKVKTGDILHTSLTKKVDLKPGNSMPVGLIRDGTHVHNIELKIGAGGALARSAGASAQILGQDLGRVILRLSSGELRYVHKSCMATVGVLSNLDHCNVVLGKAGRSVWRGWRPSVRGIAMNPVSHANGGRTNGGKHFSSPNGLCAKGLRTRRNNRTTKDRIKRRSK